MVIARPEVALLIVGRTARRRLWETAQFHAIMPLRSPTSSLPTGDPMPELPSALLVLEDGTRWPGRCLGAPNTAVAGEGVF